MKMIINIVIDGAFRVRLMIKGGGGFCILGICFDTLMISGRTLNCSPYWEFVNTECSHDVNLHASIVMFNDTTIFFCFYKYMPKRKNCISLIL